MGLDSANNKGSIIHKCNPSFSVPSVSALRGPHSPTSLSHISQRAVVSVRAHGSPDVKRPHIINYWHPTQARKNLHAVGLHVGVAAANERTFIHSTASRFPTVLVAPVFHSLHTVFSPAPWFHPSYTLRHILVRTNTVLYMARPSTRALLN